MDLLCSPHHPSTLVPNVRQFEYLQQTRLRSTCRTTGLYTFCKNHVDGTDKNDIVLHRFFTPFYFLFVISMDRERERGRERREKCVKSECKEYSYLQTTNLKFPAKTKCLFFCRLHYCLLLFAVNSACGHKQAGIFFAVIVSFCVTCEL